MMVHLHGQLTLSKIAWEENVNEGFLGWVLGDHLEYVNQYWNTCLLWGTPFPRQGELKSVGNELSTSTHTFIVLFLITDITWTNSFRFLPL